MDLKIRFTLITPTQQISFRNFEDIDHFEAAERLAERFTSWEKMIKEKAAEHVLSEAVGSEQASGYRISFVHKEKSLPDTG
jgi:hypothetical protein